MAFPRDFGRDLVAGSVDSTPGMGINEPADPIRIVALPSGSLPDGSGDPLGPGGRSQPVRSDLTIRAGRAALRGMVPSRPGSEAVLPDEGRDLTDAAPCPGPPRPAPGPAGREPTDTTRRRSAVGRGPGPRPGRMSDRARPGAARAASRGGVGRVGIGTERMADSRNVRRPETLRAAPAEQKGQEPFLTSKWGLPQVLEV